MKLSAWRRISTVIIAIVRRQDGKVGNMEKGHFPQCDVHIYKQTSVFRLAGLSLVHGDPVQSVKRTIDTGMG